MVEVAPGVSLEVLDFGGAGSPVVFLAGFGNTAHIFDDFAPRLTDQHHVYAITRRGFGASSAPDNGYDLATRVADDLSVLAALGHDRATWIGHSIAGDELTGIAAKHPSRVSALIYLDATNDHGAELEALIASMPSPPETDPPADTWNDAIKLQRWFARELGSEPPLGEVLAVLELAPNHPPRQRAHPNAGEKMSAANPRQDYAAVRAPALVLVAPPEGPDSDPGFAAMSAEQQAAYRKAWPKFEKFLQSGYDDVRLHLAGATFVVVRRSNHYLFIRSADEVLAEVRAFLANVTSGSSRSESCPTGRWTRRSG